MPVIITEKNLGRNVVHLGALDWALGCSQKNATVVQADSCLIPILALNVADTNIARGTVSSDTAIHGVLLRCYIPEV